MRRWKLVLLILIFVVIAGIVSIGFWQADNIRAGLMALTKTSDQIAVDMNTNKKQLEEELKKTYPTIISDFTAEEERMIMTGEITVEEAVEMMQERYEKKLEELGEIWSYDSKSPENIFGTSDEIAKDSKGNKKDSKNTSSNSSKGDSKQNGGKPSAGGKVSGDVDAIVGDRIVELYSLKAYYLGQLGQIEASAKSDYLSLPKEKRGLVGKNTIVNKYMGVAMGHMNSCDAKVNSLLSGLEADLKAANADTSIIKTIRDAYESEKTMKKAYYASLLD